MAHGFYEVQVLFALQTALGENGGPNSGIHGPKTRLLFSPSKEICLKKWASLSIGDPVGETWSGSFTGDYERQVIIRRAPSLGTRDICTRRPWKRTHLSMGSPSGKVGGGDPLPVNLRKG